MPETSRTEPIRSGFLELMVANRYYAIPIASVYEINPVSEITPVPKAASHLCGVMNLRGQVLPVIDLRVRLLGEVTQKTRKTCIVVTQTPEGVVGLLVDSVCRVVTFDQITATPDAFHLPDTSLVHGVASDGQKAVAILALETCVRPVDPLALKQIEELRAQGASPSSASADPGLKRAALRLIE